MDISAVESHLGIQFPSRHRAALLDRGDPIHDACAFYVPQSPHELLRLTDVHDFLHVTRSFDPWPPFLVAFASHGCGDHFAYDLRNEMQVIYIDPDLTIAENLSSTDQLRYTSFDEWYDSTLRTRRT